MTKPIQIVDLFAGPGGLGEGFNSLRQINGNRYFQTLVSAEMEPFAHKTLTLRSFYRLLKDRKSSMAPYYQYIQGGRHPSKCEQSQEIWKEACKEALCIKLGTEGGNKFLTDRLNSELDTTKHWVLIGGPPCQAYSLVGRSRNQGKKDYRPENDERHFLYKEYLRVISQFSPSIFIMENVRGILTSKIGKKRIFGQILEDLSTPNQAIKGTNNHQNEDGYTIFSLTDSSTIFPADQNNPTPLSEDSYSSFVVKSEDYEIPQARHRVILIGVRNDIVEKLGDQQIAEHLEIKKAHDTNGTTAGDVLSELPPLRSGLSRGDSAESWKSAVYSAANKIAKEIIEHPSENVSTEHRVRIAEEMHLVASLIDKSNLERKTSPSLLKSKNSTIKPTLKKWYNDTDSSEHDVYWHNHESRGHMEKDLARYLYCAVFAKVVGRTPRGSKEIYLDSLEPEHANWKTGKFADRFRVVVNNEPSKTVTSHISKDGHYFIHYDPYQCRSLTVREAARLQTFPDNYYFEGNRTEQYVQVGNAVPPLLASKIAKKTRRILSLIG